MLGIIFLGCDAMFRGAAKSLVPICTRIHGVTSKTTVS